MWNSQGTESASGHALLPLPSASTSSSSSHHHHGQAGRWFEVGEEASLKKRHGSCEIVDEEEKKLIVKEKKGPLRRKKTDQKNFNEDEGSGEKEEQEEEEKDGTDDTDLTKNKGNGNSSITSIGGGSGVVEGSRCSRVNGRGWRCCQQTLVGYALCEHHLGKGRLRSMTNVRSRSSSTGSGMLTSDHNSNNDHSGDDGSLSPLSRKQREDGDEEEEEKLMMMKEKNRNKRKRIGMVKARSISSLLGQPHNAGSTTSTAPLIAIELGSNLAAASTTV